MDTLYPYAKSIAAFAFSAFAFSLVGCTINGSYGHVEKLTEGISPAPDVHGANGYQKPGAEQVRASINIHIGSEDKAKVSGIRNEFENCGKIGSCTIPSDMQVNEDVDVSYKLNYNLINTSIEYLNKKNILLWSLGLAVNNGIYTFGTIGINTPYFEFGALAGLWLYLHDQDYSGTSYDCTKYLFRDEYSLDKDPFSVEKEKKLAAAVTYGGYASAFYGPVFLAYSLNMYFPQHGLDKDDKDNKMQADFSLPLVMTEYVTVGYHINKNWELHAGVSNTFGDFDDWHWAGTGGVSFYFK